MARWFDITSFIRPSCGTRFSEMSSREITWLGDLAQLAVDPEADAVELLVGLEVDVRGAGLDRVEEHLLQELDDRGIVDVARVDLRGLLVAGDIDIDGVVHELRELFGRTPG